MTDLEISKALALAIGWTEDSLVHGRLGIMCCVIETPAHYHWSVFDYRDWAVAGPIAERYDCFPFKEGQRGWCTEQISWSADTPQKAIALAVIQGAKK